MSNSPNDKDREQDVSHFVQDMLEEMENEFTEVGNSMIDRMDEMGKRMEELERSISDLMTDSGLEGSNKQDESLTSPTTSQATPKNKSEHKEGSPAVL